MRSVFITVLAAITAAAGAFPCASQTPTAIKLPQATPGVRYSVQLSIPPGRLGFPFTCKWTSSHPLPLGLKFDCAHLQITGIASANSATSYSSTLEFQDTQGNTMSFALVLPVSSKPTPVLLTESSAPAPAPFSAPVAVPTPVSTPAPTVSQTLAPASPSPTQAPAPVATAEPTASPAVAKPAAKGADQASGDTKPVKVGLNFTWIDPKSRNTMNATSTDPSPQVQVAECTQLMLNATVNANSSATAATGVDAGGSSISGSVHLTDSLLPKSSPLTVAISNGAGTATVPVLAPGTHKLTATFDATDKYSSGTDTITVVVSQALGQSATCPYPMPPLLLTVVGVDVEGASSTSPSATFLGDATVDLPLPWGHSTSGRMTSIDQARFFIGASARIAAMAQPGALSASSLTEGYLASAINSTPDKIVQSWEGSGSVAIKLWSSSLGIDSFDNGKPPSSTYPRNTRFVTSLLLSGGFASPLSASQANPTVYYATKQIQQAYPNITWASTCLNYLTTTPVGTPSCYAAFIPADRMRFYRHYEAGLRFKLYGEDFEHNILRFPGIVDLTAGQNEYVTGGGLNGVVVHVGGLLPVPIASIPGVYIFGATDSKINGPVGGGAQLLLQPVPSTANVSYLSNTVYDITVPQPNRDRYRFGFGVDLFQLLTAKSQKQGSTTP